MFSRGSGIGETFSVLADGHFSEMTVVGSSCLLFVTAAEEPGAELCAATEVLPLCLGFLVRILASPPYSFPVF